MVSGRLRSMGLAALVAGMAACGSFAGAQSDDDSNNDDSGYTDGDVLMTDGGPGGDADGAVDEKMDGGDGTGGMDGTMCENPRRWYWDADGDGQGADPTLHPAAPKPVESCTQPRGYVANFDDCNDNEERIFSGAAELCDGLNNRCGTPADKYVDGADHPPELSSNQRGVCEDSLRVCVDGRMADPDYALIEGYAAREEGSVAALCDALDNNCDGSVDEGITRSVACFANGALGGYNGNARWTEICESGSFVSPEGAVCEDPDVCAEGAALDPVECGVETAVPSPCSPGLETVVCEEVGGTYTFVRQGDCSGRNPPAAGEPGFNEDLDNDGTAIAYDAGTIISFDGNGIDDDCNNVVDDGILMAVIPAGEFYRGCNPDERVCPADTTPRRIITLDEYKIDLTEVTWQAIQECYDAGGPCPDPSPRRGSDSDVQPARSLSWYDAEAYCTWAGKRLPSEAEWEKAARGALPSTRVFPWGDDAPDCERANYNMCVGTTSSVGSYPAGVSDFGTLDMAGNVFEWVNDWYDQDYYDETPDSPSVNPLGPAGGTLKVQRGGSFVVDDPQILTAYSRFTLNPASPHLTLGFRCAGD